MSLTRRAALGGLMAGAALPSAAQPAPSDRPSRIKHLAYSDQGGRPDGVQVMVSRKHVIVGHMFNHGFTIIDVNDPTKPKPVNFVTNGPNTRSHHLQAHDDLLLVANGADIPTLKLYNPNFSYYQNFSPERLPAERSFAAGLRIYDIKDPANPREIAFLDMPGVGINRLWYVGGRYAYVSAHADGFTDHFLHIVDVSKPTKPEVVSRWWMPGMWRDGGEMPGWKGRVALHHMIVAGDTGYAAWRDGGFTVFDVTDRSKPALLSHTNTAPPYPGGTHTPLPLPGRGLAIVADESNAFQCGPGLSYTWVMDVRDRRNPVSIATLPTPKDRDWCRPGENFGPHNLHENRPGTFQSEETIFATYHNAGLRIFDIRDPYGPREIDRFVAGPPARILDPRPGNALAPQTCDVNVQPDGVMYLSDWNGGLNVLEYGG